MKFCQKNYSPRNIADLHRILYKFREIQQNSLSLRLHSIAVGLLLCHCRNHWYLRRKCNQNAAIINMWHCSQLEKQYVEHIFTSTPILRNIHHMTLKWYRVPDFLLSCIPGNNLKELSEGFLFSYKEKRCVVNSNFRKCL